jgi:hypothetical protein
LSFVGLIIKSYVCLYQYRGRKMIIWPDMPFEEHHKTKELGAKWDIKEYK